MSINLTTWASSTRRPGASNTTFNRWTRPAKRCTGFKPVTFKLNSDWKGTKQYGLIAEEVAEVDPQLVVHGKNGDVTAVHYEQINNMLLNEFLKEHKKVEELQATSRPATEGNGRSHGPAQRAGRANPKSERPARDEQTSRQKWS